MDKNIKFTREDKRDISLPFHDCDVSLVKDGNLSIEIYRKPTHTDQYLLFDSHHPLAHKPGVTWTLKDRPQKVPSITEGKQKELRHIKTALQTCDLVKLSKRRPKELPETERENRKKLVIQYVAGLMEKFRRIFQKHKS